MQGNAKFLYPIAILFPIILGYLIWDIKGDIYELTGNIRLAQYKDRKGKTIFPRDVLFVEKHIDDKYLDKSQPGNPALLIFGQRNPDLPNYSLYLKILGENPEQMKALFKIIEDDFVTSTQDTIDNIKKLRMSQLDSIKSSISVIEKFKSATPSTLKDGEAFMTIYKQLNELKEQREFLEISLDPQSLFNFHRLGEPSIKKKRDKSTFVISVIGGVLFLMVFFCYLIWRLSEMKGNDR